MLASLIGIVVWLENNHLDGDGWIYQTKTNILTIGQLLEVFQLDFKRYPSSAEGLQKLCELYEAGKPTYSRFCHLRDFSGNPFIYRETPNAKHPFELYSVGKNGIDEQGTGDDLNYWPQD